jgi:predicted flap endonuclease-1-like 5' DNA nuclease
VINMNPISVIVGFTVILAVLIYYLQSREPVAETIPKETPESNIVKVKDYKEQFEVEQKEAPKENSALEEKIPKTSSVITGIDNIAELEGVGPKYQELLRSAGYTSIKSIAESSPNEMYEALMKANEEKGITKRPPTLQNIEDWIKAAGSR